jgi:hypothetical protein
MRGAVTSGGGGVVLCEVEGREKERPAAGINIGNLMASGIHVL